MPPNFVGRYFNSYVECTARHRDLVATKSAILNDVGDIGTIGGDGAPKKQVCLERAHSTPPVDNRIPSLTSLSQKSEVVTVPSLQPPPSKPHRTSRPARRVSAPAPTDPRVPSFANAPPSPAHPPESQVRARRDVVPAPGGSRVDAGRGGGLTACA